MIKSFHNTLANGLLLGALALATIMLNPITVDAQTIDVGPPDTSVCNGTPIDLIAVTTGGGGGAGSAVDLAFNNDDGHSPVVDIGFPFEYFGNIYTQCVISTNGYVTFDLGTAGTGSPWAINAASPTPGVPDNAIMFPWQDINPGAGSGGTNAADCGDGVFIVDFTDIAMFSCTTLSFSMQVKLYENTNVIETHIANKPICAAWNGGAAIHGLENAGGTQSVIVPGRNFPSQWAATNDAVRFTPDGFGSYTIDETIPFNPTPIGTEVLEWTDGDGNVLGSTNTITVTPTEPTWYFCSYRSACSVIEVVDSILVTLGNVDITAEPTDASCFEFTDGYVVVDPIGSTYPVSLEVIDATSVTAAQSNNVFGIDTLGGLGEGTYSVTVTDGVGCQTSLNFDISHPTLLVPNASHHDILCNGDDNGTAVVAPSGGTPFPNGTYNVQWSDPLAQTTDSVLWLAPGALTATVTDAQGCVADTTLTILEPLPLVLNLTSGADTCLYTNGAVLAEMQGGVAPYYYNWSSVGGDSANFSMDTITYTWSRLDNLSHGVYNLVVTDTNECVIESGIEVALIPPPYGSFTSRSKPTEFIDPNVQFANESTGALTYEWHFGDGDISYDEHPEHAYDTSGVFLVMMIAYNEPNYGCADTTFRYMEVDPMFTFYVPSGFTPDDDGLNDEWGPVGQNFEYESYNVQIYDRWGKLIWQTDNPDKLWDGTMRATGKNVKQGLYVYAFTIKKFNTFEPKVIKGTVTLYRHNDN
ncbi:MAG: gliding motility-associated C-terminal domain-containing protein [Flavobacteriales bacterium]